MLRRSLVSAMAGIALLTACGDSTGPAGSIAGTYRLETIDGAPLPVTLFELGTYRAEAVAGDLVMRSDGTFSTSLTLREADVGSVIETRIICTGTYTVSGNVVTFTESGSANVNCADGVYDATWTGDTIRVEDLGIVAVYRR